MALSDAELLERVVGLIDATGHTRGSYKKEQPSRRLGHYRGIP